MGPVFGGESFGRSCDERELCSWKMNIENVNFVYKLICGGLFVRRADYLKTSKVRHKEAEEASLMVGLGASGGLCTIVLQQNNTHICIFLY